MTLRIARIYNVVMLSYLIKIPVQEEYDELKYRIDRMNDDKNELIGKMQALSESSAILDREVHRTIFAPPNPAIALLRRDLNAVITRQADIETKLAHGARV